MEKEARIEASIPVQSRVNLVSLARLSRYWEENGYEIRTMSQLVNWSIDLLVEVMVANNKIDESDVDSLAKAKQVLEIRGFFQNSLKKRSFKKIGQAMTFESLRNEGVNPRQYAPVQHSILHRSTSVKPFQGQVTTGQCSDILDEAFIKLREVEEEERKKSTEDAIAKAKACGLVADEDEYMQQRLAKQRKLFEERQLAIEAKKKALNSDKKEEGVKSVKEGMTEEEFYADAAERDRKLQEEEDRAMEEFIANGKNVIVDESS